MDIAALFALGLIVGWYVTLVAYRVPVGQPLWAPLTCSNCNEVISRPDSLPVVGWFLAGGRCRQCGGRLPMRYPLVALATATLFGLLAGRVGFNLILPSYLAFAAVTMCLVLTDLDWKRIPNAILFKGGGVAVGLLAIGSLSSGHLEAFIRALGGGIIHFGLLFGVALLAPGGMGMGDVKLVALLGIFTAYFSWTTLAVSIFGGVLIGGLIGLVLLVTGMRGRKDEVPFGPSLTLGAWLAMIWGPIIGPWLFGGGG